MRNPVPDDFVRSVALPVLMYDGTARPGTVNFLSRTTDATLPREDNLTLVNFVQEGYGALISICLNPAGLLAAADAFTRNARCIQRLFAPRAVRIVPSVGDPIIVEGGHTFSLVDDRLIIRDREGVELGNYLAAEYTLDWQRP